MGDTVLSEAAGAVAALPLDRSERRGAIARHPAAAAQLLFGPRPVAA